MDFKWENNSAIAKAEAFPSLSLTSIFEASLNNNVSNCENKGIYETVTPYAALLL